MTAAARLERRLSVVVEAFVRGMLELLERVGGPGRGGSTTPAAPASGDGHHPNEW